MTDSHFPPTPPSPPPVAQVLPPQPPRRGGGLARVLAVLFFLFLLASLAANMVLVILWMTSVMGQEQSPSASVQQEIVRQGGHDKVAILPANGAVDEQMVDRIRKFIDAINHDKAIKAVVVEVDSPGGGITASDEIHHMLKELGQKKKLVVSMGAVAASGGYYISTPAEKIYAEPTTLTGSIGVIWPAFEVSDLLNKIGVTPQIITSDEAKFKDKGSPFRKFTEEDVKYIKALVNDAHDKFKKIVKEGRGSKIPDVDKVAIGEVWPAQKAQTLGLVDEIAYLDDVCERTAHEAGVSDPTIVRLKERHGLFELLGAQTPVTTNGKVSIEIDPKKAIMDLATPRLEYRWVP